MQGHIDRGVAPSTDDPPHFAKDCATWTSRWSHHPELHINPNFLRVKRQARIRLPQCRISW